MILPNFPIVSQLSTLTQDGLPSENTVMDCVPSSILACMMYWMGMKEVNKEWNPDRILNLAYPEGYKGGTAAIAYVEPLKKLGFKLSSFDSNPANLVVKAHEYLAQKIPVIFTQIDPYVDTSLPQFKDWSHVCAWCGDGVTNGQRYLTAMDPYPAKMITLSDSTWTGRLLFNEIWILEKEVEEVPVIMDMNNPVIAAFFTENQGQWQSKTTGKSIKGALLNFYQRYGNSAFCGLTYLGLPLSNEIPLDPQFPHCVKQYFERGVLCFDQAHIVANPPGSGEVYLLHLYGGDKAEGIDPMVTELQQQLAAAQKTDTTQLQADLTKYKTMAHQIALIVQGE